MRFINFVFIFHMVFFSFAHWRFDRWPNGFPKRPKIGKLAGQPALEKAGFELFGHKRPNGNRADNQLFLLVTNTDSYLSRVGEKQTAVESEATATTTTTTMKYERQSLGSRATQHKSTARYIAGRVSRRRRRQTQRKRRR